MPDLGVYNLTSLTGLLGPGQGGHSDGQHRHAKTHGRRQGRHQGRGRGQRHGPPGSWQRRLVARAVRASTTSIPTDTTAGDSTSTRLPSWVPTGTWAGRLRLGASESTSRPVTETRRVSPATLATYVWQQGASVIAECLATGKEPLIAVEHALHVLEIIEAARASGRMADESSSRPRSSGRSFSDLGVRHRSNGSGPHHPLLRV